MQPLAAAPEVGIGIDQLKAQTESADAQAFVKLSADFFGQGLAMTTSFGIHSAVMLHLVTRVIPKLPVIWIDTGYLFAETYQFAETLTQRLALNLKVYQSVISPARMEAISGRLWSGEIEALNRYDRIRKIEPLQRALGDLSVKACFAGLRAEQTEYRRKLQRISWIDNRYSLLPILDWTSDAVLKYLTDHDLPSHPLREKGYATVGDWHSSRPLSPDDKHERNTRFRGLKQECGIHLPLTPEAEESLKSSGL